MRRTAKGKITLLDAPVVDVPLVDEPVVGDAPQQQSTPPAAGGCRVILYNDDYHGQGEVAEQLHKATEYSLLRCWMIMLEAHTTGRAVCYHGTREKCHRVARILREIRLQCEVDCDESFAAELE
jgi:ATP-dependent Clp protease adapter protein ClpS